MIKRTVGLEAAIRLNHLFLRAAQENGPCN